MRRRERNPVELCDEAVSLLRRSPVSALFSYYMGSLPFVLGFLFFWADMSQSAFAYEQCATASLGLALLYLWMCGWQAVFARKLRSELSGAKDTGWSRASLSRPVLVQCAIQPTKFLVLPIAALILMPYAPAYAFYHAAMAVPDEQAGTVGATVAAAKRQANLWPRQNWTLMGILNLLGIVVFLNVGITLFLLPQLLRMFLGIETVFTRAPISTLNTTFLAICAGLTYLVVNPLVKAVYVLRGFYGESLETGEDLRAALRSSVPAHVAPLALILAFGICFSADAQTTQPRTPAAASIEELDHAIDTVLRNSEFTWRLPRLAKPPDNRANGLIRATEAVLKWIAGSIRQVSSGIKHLIQWLIDQWKGKLGWPGKPGPAISSTRLRTLLYSLLLLITVVLIWLLRATLRERNRSKAVSAAPVVMPSVDMNREDLQADEQPLGGWLRLAREHTARQEMRLAVRALYLASLAYLSEGALITIQRGKSDLDYARELRRRGRGKPEVLTAFAWNMDVFERAWYGMYDVDSAMFREFEDNLALMRSRAAQR